MNEPSASFEKHITIRKNDLSLLDCLSQNCPEISKQKLKLAMKYGAVWITSNTKKNQSGKTLRIRRAKKVLRVGDQIHLYYNETILFSEIKPAKLVSSEGEYSIWDKPGGMYSQGSKWADHSSICRWVELFGLADNQLELRPVFSVHRLDRATNGLIMVAHSKQAAARLAQLFESRKVEKQYSAVVKGEYLSTPEFQTLDTDIDDKTALSLVLSSVYKANKHQTSLIIEIKTGRKHQIRKHLSGVGYPIIGDRLYGKEIKKVELQPDLMLRSCLLGFECPFTQEQRNYQLKAY